MLERVRWHAAERPGARVKRVALTVGEFAGVDSELIRLAFADLTLATELSDAQLCLEEVPLTGECTACGAEFRIEQFRFVCPKCDGRAIQVLRGEGLMLEQIDFELDEVSAR